MQLFHSPQIAPGEHPLVRSRRLQVFVLFTGKDSTIAALRTAAQFVSGLGGEIVIAVTQIVPYPLPLNRPPVDRAFLLDQITEILAQAGIGADLSPKILLVYARDFAAGCRTLLPPHCIVVVGSEKRSPFQRLRSWSISKSLRKRGHEVVTATSAGSDVCCRLDCS